jgi:hypothetical protein
MARARFFEIRRCAGVDETAVPAGMVVPLRGTNQFVLETSGMEMKVTSSHRGIAIEEFDGKDVQRQLIELNNALYQPGVDPLLKEALLPTALYLYKPRYYRVHGRVPIGSPGAVIKAEPVPVPGRKAPSIGPSMDVLCLDTMIIKVAIRNVKARDEQGNIRYHARLPCDPAAELVNMNAVWTPQANIKFELVPSSDLLIDHNDKTMREELRKAYGMKDISTATFNAGSVVVAEKTWDIFAKHKVSGAHITFFLVHSVIGADGPAMGTMNSNLGLSFISGTHVPTTFAHEAGHYLGRRLVGKQWAGHEHHDESQVRDLMKRGGSSWAIPFGMVKRARAFSGKPAP